MTDCGGCTSLVALSVLLNVTRRSGCLAIDVFESKPLTIAQNVSWPLLDSPTFVTLTFKLNFNGPVWLFERSDFRPVLWLLPSVGFAHLLHHGQSPLPVWHSQEHCFWCVLLLSSFCFRSCRLIDTLAHFMKVVFFSYL